MNADILRVALAAALASLALAGCQREAGEPTVGQKLDNAIDRTQQKAEQEKLARSENRYRSLVTATSSVVWITDAIR